MIEMNRDRSEAFQFKSPRDNYRFTYHLDDLVSNFPFVDPQTKLSPMLDLFFAVPEVNGLREAVSKAEKFISCNLLSLLQKVEQKSTDGKQSNLR